MAHLKQSGSDYGLGFQAKVVEAFGVVPSSLGSGTLQGYLAHKKAVPEAASRKGKACPAPPAAAAAAAIGCCKVR